MTSKRTSIAIDRPNTNWHWAMISLSCFAGCSTLHEAGETVSQPIRSSGGLLARSAERIGERVEDSFESAQRSSPQPKDVADRRAPQTVAASKVPTYPRTLGRPTPLMAPTVSPEANSVIADHSAPITTTPNPYTSVPVEILPAPPASESAAQKLSEIWEGEAPFEPRTAGKHGSAGTSPSQIPSPRIAAQSSHQPNITPPSPTQLITTSLLAPPPAPASESQNTSSIPAVLSPQIANQSLPVIPIPNAPAPATVASDDVTWVRVRVKNIGNRPATQVAVSVISPVNTKLIPSDGGQLPPNAQSRIDFSRLEQVAPGEEIDAIVGLPAKEARSKRLRVQVRDGQGGTNQEVQARWQVSIESN